MRNMEGFRILVSDFMLTLASEELIILGTSLAAIVILTAGFVARELRKNSGGKGNDK